MVHQLTARTQTEQQRLSSHHLPNSRTRSRFTSALQQTREFIPGQRSTPVRQPELTAHPVDETVCTLNRSQLAARQAVPKELPDFDGNAEDWPLFFSTFNSSTRICGFSNEENMLRLRKCLHGKALEAVRSRLLHPSNVSGVLSTLKMLYGRPEALILAITKRIRGLAPPTIDRLDTVVNFAMAVENLMAIIQACEANDFVYNTSLRYELIEKLQPTPSWPITESIADWK